MCLSSFVRSVFLSTELHIDILQVDEASETSEQGEHDRQGDR